SVVIYDRPDGRGVLQESMRMDSTGLTLSADSRSASYSVSGMRSHHQRGSIQLAIDDIGQALLWLDSSKPASEGGGVSGISLSANKDTARVNLSAAERVQDLSTIGKNSVELTTDGNGDASINLNDRAGFAGKFGTADLLDKETGEKRKTSA